MVLLFLLKNGLIDMLQYAEVCCNICFVVLMSFPCYVTRLQGSMEALQSFLKVENTYFCSDLIFLII